MFQGLGLWHIFPGGSVVRNPPANARDPGDTGLIPELGRSPGEGHGNPLQYSCLDNPMAREAWWATVRGVAEPDTAWARTHVLFDGCRPDHSNTPCVSPLLFQVHRRLLLHPFLCGRPAGRGPPLSQLQSSPGHLQAFVGLSQAWREPCAAGRPLRLFTQPLLLVKALPWWSRVSRGSTFVSSFGGKISQKSHTSKPQKWLLGVVHRHAKTFSLSAGSRVFCLPPPPDRDPKSFHLTVIVVPSEYLLVICHWLASILASVGLSLSGLQIRSPRLPYFETVLAPVRLNQPLVPTTIAICFHFW